MVDAEQLLHDLGRGRNLQSGDRTVDGLPQGTQGFLCGIGFENGGRRQLGRQVLIPSPVGMGVGNEACSTSGIERLRHGWLAPSFVGYSKQSYRKAHGTARSFDAQLLA